MPSTMNARCLPLERQSQGGSILYPYRSQSQSTSDCTVQRSASQVVSKALLDLPVELLTLIAMHMVTNPSRHRQKGSLDQRRNHRRRQVQTLGNLDFEHLISLGMTCRALHPICRKIYQKKLVLSIPSRHPVSFQELCSRESREQDLKRTIRSKDGIYARTIEEQDRLAQTWSGVHNVSWLLISSQAYHRPKSSNLFHGLVDSTARLVKSFGNLRYLCLSRLNDEIILDCLETGVGQNLEALSITLSDTDESENGIPNFEDRISKITSISRIQALQLNDIEPTWVGLIDRVVHLRELSLHISNLSSPVIQSLGQHTSLLNLEVQGGLRSPSSGRRLVEALTRTFPWIEVLKLGIHFQDPYNGQRSMNEDYSGLISNFQKLKQFVFNHANLASAPDYSDSWPPVALLEQFYECSIPYLQRCLNLNEVVSFDPADKQSTTAFVATKMAPVPSSQDPENGGFFDTLGPKGDKKVERIPEGIRHVTQNHWDITKVGEGGNTEKTPIHMYKVEDIKDRFMIPFELRWTRLEC